MMRIYSGTELEEIMQRQSDVLRERRNMDCFFWASIGFLIALAAGCAAYSLGWLP
jgi:hypothetical protein